MNNLKDFSEEQLVEMLKRKEITRADFLDSGICPNCFDRRHNGIIYGDDSARMLYEDDTIECLLVDNPRAPGHTMISTKKHFKDMMELDDETCRKVFVMAKRVMKLIKEVYHTASVYECTMCDGEMNHFHIQLIPRYEKEERGSKNFTKDRQVYVEDKEKLQELREQLKH